MKPRMKTSPAARELIKRFEPFKPQAEQGDDGRWVVGYGHRAAAKSGVRVNEDEAALLLIYDVMRAEEVVDESITGPLSRGQRDALTSFVHDVGIDSFRRSEVARYLFEGRARAAGEALASHDDGTSARREAESRLFLDALLPASPGKARKSEPVELVIKIEHPAEERVLEGAIAGADAPPAELSPDLPPPPPPFDAGLARRREAEDEIARILATVEALPPEVRRELGETEMAPVAEAVSEMRDDPIEARYEAVDDAPEADAAPAEEAAAETEVADETGPAIESDGETESSAAIDPETAADRVIARMAEDIAGAEGELDRNEEAGEAQVDSPAIAQVETETVESDAPEIEEADIEAAVIEDAVTDAAMSQAASDEAPAPSAAPLAAFDLPDGMGLGFVLTDRQPAEPSEQTEAPATASVSSETAPAVPEHYALELPAGMGLGYALTSVMQGSFLIDSEIDTTEAAPDDAASDNDLEAETGSGLTSQDGQATDLQGATTEEDHAAQPAGAQTDGETDPLPVNVPEADIVERTIALTGDDTPPPHPAEMPAEARGAVGDVEGEPVADAAADHASIDDIAGADPLMAGDDPMADGADDFTPSDLAADVHATTPRPGPRSDDGLWTFLAVLIAGGLLAGFGSVLAAAEWDYIMAQREMTLNFGMAIAGFFLVIVAGWQLVSIWLSKLKQKASD